MNGSGKLLTVFGYRFAASVGMLLRPEVGEAAPRRAPARTGRKTSSANMSPHIP